MSMDGAQVAPQAPKHKLLLFCLALIFLAAAVLAASAAFMGEMYLFPFLTASVLRWKCMLVWQSGPVMGATEMVVFDQSHDVELASLRDCVASVAATHSEQMRYVTRLGTGI